jgi:prepilin-type N-terminal cleavage/methylation domain-containing protein
MRRFGFTQIELMIVIVVCGVLATLAVPRFARLRDASSVRAAMTDLGAAFATARQAAVIRRATVALVFDTANGVVRLSSAGETLLRRSLRASYSVSLGANRDSAVYDPRGLGYGVTNLSVTVRRGSFVDTLTMSRLGRTSW